MISRESCGLHARTFVRGSVQTVATSDRPHTARQFWLSGSYGMTEKIPDRRGRPFHDLLRNAEPSTCRARKPRAATAHERPPMWPLLLLLIAMAFGGHAWATDIGNAWQEVRIRGTSPFPRDNLAATRGIDATKFLRDICSAAASITSSVARPSSIHCSRGRSPDPKTPPSSPSPSARRTRPSGARRAPFQPSGRSGTAHKRSSTCSAAASTTGPWP